MPNAANPIEQQLAQLRASFAERLPERIAEIEDAWNAILRNAWGEETGKRLHRLAHTLAGSSATFGYAAVSQSARELEHALQPPLEQCTALTEEQQTQIAALLAAMKNAAPGAQADAPIQPPTHAADAPSLVGERDFHRLVFLVQDEKQTGDLVRQIGYFGYSVQIARRVDELVEQVKRTLPSAVLFDADGSRGESASLFAQIKSSVDAHLPILFLSARGDLESRLNAVRVGADAYFAKPVNVSRLIEKLDLLTANRAPDPYRILIMEDETWLADYYALILKQTGMETCIVNDPAQLLPQLMEFKPDLILMDVYMPQCSGLELAAVIRQQQDYVSIPIVYLSTETNVEKQLAAMSLGGDDFLTKPIQPDHLISSVTSRAQRSHALRALILRDSLTGLLNHTAIKGRLDVEIAHAQRNGTPLAYVMLDIDRFKLVNDTYGHPMGDDVLKSLARLLQQRLRRTDVIGRYGGEEFAILLPQATAVQAKQVMDKIREGFAQVHQQSNGADFTTTFSAGIAAYPAFNAACLNDAADRALYEAKQNGRNRIVLANS